MCKSPKLLVLPNGRFSVQPLSICRHVSAYIPERSKKNTRRLWGGFRHMARHDLAAAVFRLQRHEMKEEPDGSAQRVGYVALLGSDTLKVARWRNGERLTDKLKPFAEGSQAWFSIEVRNG